MRYLTGFTLAEGEEKVAGNSGQFLVGGDEVVDPGRLALHDPGRAARRPRRASSRPTRTCRARWPELVASVGARRVAVEAGFVPHATWQRLAAAAPDVELVPVEGWLEADRAVKEPAEIERIAAACAVADRALAALLPEIRTGATEADLALRLEWLMRTGGAEALAFDVACLSGPEAALPHGAPGDRPIRAGTVLLFDFGAQVAGYRSDMTRTLFVGEPAPRDLDIYDLVARAQAAAIAALEAAVGADGTATDASVPLPSGRAIDAIARGVIEAAGHGAHFGHGTGHGIGLATHEAPSLGRLAPDDAAAQPDRLLGRARRLPRGRDGRPDRGPGRARCIGRAARAPDPVPARGARRRGLTQSRAGSSATIGARTVPIDPVAARVRRSPDPRPSRPGARPHDQHR